MAKNDMEIIMYKILVYLYECMKEGKIPRVVDYGWESEMFSISQTYWIQVIQELVRLGLITGVSIRGTKDGPIVNLENPMITYEGRMFLLENSLMQKVKEAVGESFRVVLSGIFGHVI